MKWTSYLLVLPFLFLLAACPNDDKPQEDVAPEGSINPLCSENSSSCDMKWIILYKPKDFPENFQILINNQKVFDRCRDTHVAVERTVTGIQLVMWDYRRLKGAEKFSFEIRKIADCNEPEKGTTFDLNNPQAFEVQDLYGEKVVMIRN